MDVIGDCVELGTTTRPRIRVKGRAVNAGRVIMGVIDDPAVWVLHRCNNPPVRQSRSPISRYSLRQHHGQVGSRERVQTEP
jgi:hypothetical protein